MGVMVKYPQMFDHVACMLTFLLSFCSSPVPKVKMIDERLGPLVQEFKDLVYPADYNPDGKPSAKRKPGEGLGF